LELRSRRHAHQRWMRQATDLPPHRLGHVALDPDRARGLSHDLGISDGPSSYGRVVDPKLPRDPSNLSRVLPVTLLLLLQRLIDIGAGEAQFFVRGDALDHARSQDVFIAEFSGSSSQ